MYYANRVKFAAAVVSGAIVSGVALPGFKSLQTNDIGGQYWAFLLEDGAGAWEIGLQQADAARTVVESSAGTSPVFVGDTSGLTCTLVVPASGYVNSGESAVYGSALLAPAKTIGFDALAVGRGASATGPRSVVIGTGAGLPDPTDCDESVIIGHEAISTNKRSIALGAQSRTAHVGEAVIGSFDMSHISSIAVTTDPPTGGGTFALQSIAATDAYGYPTELAPLSAGVVGPENQIYAVYMIRVQGTVAVKGADVNDRKIFSVDYATSGSELIYNNTEAVFVGSNSPSITFAVAGSLQPTLTVAAGVADNVSGVLRVDKLFFAA